MKINPIKMLQLSAAALVLSAFAYGDVSAAEKKKEAAKPPPPATPSRTRRRARRARTAPGSRP